MITLDDLIERFGENELIELTDHDRYQVIDETVAGHAMRDAVAEIESYLGGLLIRDGDVVVYAYGATPKSLTLKACDIARYYLYENRMTDTVEKRYTLAIEWLKMIQRRPSLLTGHLASGGVEVMPNPIPTGWE